MALISEDEAIDMAIREAESLYLDTAIPPLVNGSEDQNSSQPEQDMPRCRFCASLSTDDKMLKDFGVSVCFGCKLANREEFRCISKSRAMKEYLLTDDEMSKLGSTTVKNPNKVGWQDMKLYLVTHVKLEAARKWGSLVELEEEKKRRLEAKAAVRRGKSKKKISLTAPLETQSNGSSLIEREIKKQKSAAALMTSSTPESPTRKPVSKPPVQLPNVFTKVHTHVFGPEIPSEKRPSEFIKRCIQCGLEVVSESF